MEEQTLAILLEKGDFVLDQDHQTQESIEHQTQESSESQSSDQTQNRVLLKIDDLNTKIQILKKEHMDLSEEVKGVVTNDTFPGPDVSATLRVLCNENEIWKKKYFKEYFERKRLYNEVIELKGNIRVFCRCRPLNKDEISSGSSSVVEFDPSQETELQIMCADSSKKQFKFDHVFSPQENQEPVFAQTSPLVISVLDGYNVCIFAYGQTGTGKTFTMEGTSENRGVNYRTLEELFRISKERSDTMKYELFVSMLEVYNEKIRDLLVDDTNQPVKKLEIKQSAEGTQEVPGLVEARVSNTDEVWEHLKTGSQIRAVGSTNCNELSSRSHCLFRVTVKGENLVNGQRTRSHLWLVDLAGSERVGRTEVEGERLKESQFINKSLSALGDVISALASKTAHIPYRNSKLTHLLQSSLGGDCKTLMFVQISPSDADLGETLCSLNFASRVRGIEHGPARKQADPTEHFKYKQMAEKLRQDEKEIKKLQEKLRQDEKEIKKLQDNLQSWQLRFAAREQLCRGLQGLQEKLRDVENQLAEERKTKLQQQTRAVAAFSANKPPALPQQGQKVPTERKPPLGPSKFRPPLRGITNYLPPQSPLAPVYKTSGALRVSDSREDKENSDSRTKALMRPRRVSIAVRPPSGATQQLHQPKRRVSIATFRPEQQSVSMMSPMTTSNRPNMGRHSFARDPRRISRIFSPIRETRSTAVEATPISNRSKFLGSPPGGQVGSWKPKHPTVVALQRRSLVWSPLRQKGFKNDRKSLVLPSRLSENWR